MKRIVKGQGKSMSSAKEAIKSFFKNNYLSILCLILLIPIYIILYKIYILRINAFGCGDDCNNFIRGYFVLSGKLLYLQVFSGHQPLGSYISALIQYLTSPQNIFELILRHRQFILLFGFLFNALLIFRFGARILLFVIVFEFSKFYLFGDRFLSENMIVYPLVYLIGITMFKLQKQKRYLFDYILAAIFCWFVIFSRAPYIPLVLFTFLIFVWDKPMLGKAKLSIFLLAALSFVTIFTHNIGEYFYDVVIFNMKVNVAVDFGSTGLSGPRILQIFFYPLYIVFFGKENIFRNLLLGVDIIFLLYFIKLFKDKSYKVASLIFLVLGFSNIRTIFPGTVFYYAFQMLVWYGIFIFITCQLLFNKIKNRVLFIGSLLAICLFFIVFIFSPNFFAWEKIDQQTELITNYGTVLQEGEVIKILSKSTDSLFLDDSDDLIYWQAKRLSNYKYAWYTSSMPALSKFRDERIKMFKENPPDFYREYGFCPKKTELKDRSLPAFIVNDYIRVETDGRQSCLFVRKEKLKEITPEQWKKVALWHFNLPQNGKN